MLERPCPIQTALALQKAAIISPLGIVQVRFAKQRHPFLPTVFIDFDIRAKRFVSYLQRVLIDATSLPPGPPKAA
jgi:hypothetical protein